MNICQSILCKSEEDDDAAVAWSIDISILGFSTRGSLVTSGNSAETSWEASALAWVHSSAEYCAPLWYRSAHIHKLDTKLNEAVHIISETIISTHFPWLPVLAHVPQPDLRPAVSEW